MRAYLAAMYVPGHASDDGSTYTEHLEGVPWYEAPLPRRWHRCWVQTRGWRNWATLIERCACGAAAHDGKVIPGSKNLRRKK